MFKKIALVVLALSMSSVSAFAAQETRGMGHGQFKTEAVCDLFRGRDGKAYIGVIAPSLVTDQNNSLYVKSGALAPRGAITYTELKYVRGMPLPNGNVIEIYEGEEFTARLLLTRGKFVSATIYSGKATAQCKAAN